MVQPSFNHLSTVSTNGSSNWESTGWWVDNSFGNRAWKSFIKWTQCVLHQAEKREFFSIWNLESPGVLWFDSPDPFTLQNKKTQRARMDPPLKTGPKPLVDLSVAGDGLDAFPQGLVSQQLDSWYTWWNRRPNDHRIWLLSACLTPISAAHEIVTLHFANSNRYQLIPIDHELYPSGTQHHQILATHQRIFAPRHPSVTRHEPEQCQAKRTKSGP